MAVFIFGIHVGMNCTTCAWGQSSRNSPVLSSFWKDLSGLETTQAPTIAIFSLDMKLKSFGYEAERQIQESNTDNMLVFSDFIRQIFCDGLNVKGEVKAENGQTVCSGEIMAKILKFLLTKFPLQEYPTLYVLTVPSTTIDQTGARSFIKKVAKKVGMENVLVIPEAVAVFSFCRESGILSENKESVSKCTQCIVLECEENSIKCSVVEEMERHCIQITYQSFSQKPFFREMLHNFENIFVNIFGKDVFEDFVRNCRSEYNDLVNDLRRKINLSQKNRKVTLHIPSGIMEEIKDVGDKHIKNAIQQSVYADCISNVNESIRISPDFFHNLFLEIGANVKKLLKDCFDSSRLSKVGSVNIIVVGNLASSAILTNTIKYAFPSHPLVVPMEPNFVVVKGALIYGQERRSDTRMENTDEDNDEDLAAPKYITSSPAQCIVENTKAAQCAVRRARSTQAQCAVRKSMSTQSDAGHTETATIIYDRIVDYEAKKFDNEDNRRVVKKKPASEDKDKKNCIIS